MKKFKKSLALLLAFVMCLSLFPVNVFAADIQPEHVHGENCVWVDDEPTLVCGTKEHQHTSDCYTTTGPVPVCSAVAHTHTDACAGTAPCALEEHVHGDDCLDDCASVEHTHTDACAGAEPCALDEHVHGDGCYALFCGKAEHTHDEETCVIDEETGECTLEEHTHSMLCCVKTVLTCGLEEHTHTEDCYEANGHWECPVDEDEADAEPEDEDKTDAEPETEDKADAEPETEDEAGVMPIAAGESKDVSSFAEIQSAIDNAQGEITINLTKDLNGNGDQGPDQTITVPTGKTVIFNGNGHTIYRAEGTSTILFQVNGGSLTLNSVTLSGLCADHWDWNAHAQWAQADGGWRSAPLAEVNGGMLTLGSGTLLDRNWTRKNDTKGGGVRVNSGTLNMAGGRIENCDATLGNHVYLGTTATFIGDENENVYREGGVVVTDRFNNQEIFLVLNLDVGISGQGVPGEPKMVANVDNYWWVKPNYEVDTGTTYEDGSFNAGDRYHSFGTTNANYISRAIEDDEHFGSNDGMTSGLYDATGAALMNYLGAIPWNTILTQNWEHIRSHKGLPESAQSTNYTIVPYVIKFQTDEGNLGWHIDCAVLPTSRVQLNYDTNLLKDEVVTSSGFTSVEGTLSDTRISEAVKAMKTSAGAINVGDKLNVARNGEAYQLTFKGWSTSKNGSVEYKPGENITVESGQRILYAIWDRGNEPEPEKPEPSDEKAKIEVKYYSTNDYGILFSLGHSDFLEDVPVGSTWSTDDSSGLATISVSDGQSYTVLEGPHTFTYSSFVNGKLTTKTGTYAYDYVAENTGSGTVAEANKTYTIKVVYAPDNWKDVPGGPDEEDGGDGIPDKYQVRVLYQVHYPNLHQGRVGGQSDEYGETVEILTPKSDGKGGWTRESLTLMGETAVPFAGFAFAHWHLNMKANIANVPAPSCDDITENDLAGRCLWDDVTAKGHPDSFALGATYNYNAEFKQAEPEPTPEVTGFTKELVSATVNGKTVDSVRKGDKVTLTYKLVVEGDPGASYTVSDDGTTLVSGSWSGTLDETGKAEVTVSKTVTVSAGKDKNITDDGKLFVFENTAHVTGDPNKPEIPSNKVKTEIPVVYDLFVIYLYNNHAGAVAAPQVEQRSVKPGTSYSIDSPVIPGYTTTKPVVEGNKLAQDEYIYVFYTARTDLSYTVKYLENGTNKVLHDPKVVDGQTFNTEVTETAIDIEGYKLFGDNEKTITIKVDGNEIIFYYVADNSQTKQLTYTVEYYKDGEKAATEVVNETVQVLEPDTLTVKVDDINTTDKFGVGYKFVETDPTVIPETVNSGDVIRVYYVTDDSQTKELSYTVEYYKDGVKVEADTQTVKQTVQVLQPDTLTVDKSQINITDKYEGYKCTTTEIPETVNNGGVIKVEYVTDDSQTKELSYTVEYYKNGVKDESKTQTVTETVQVLKPDTLTVKADDINTTDMFGKGYAFDHTDPAEIPATIADNGVIITRFSCSRTSFFLRH